MPHWDTDDEDTSWGCDDSYPHRQDEGPEARLAREALERETAAAAEAVRRDAAILKLWRSLGRWDAFRLLPKFVAGRRYPHRRF